MKQQLTPAEAAFAAENCGIIQTYLESKGLPEDEYYDVIVFGFLKSVRQYMTDMRTEETEFEPLSLRAMDECLENYLSLQDGRADILSIHDVCENSLMLEEQLSGAADTAKEAIDRINIEKLLHSFSDTERAVAILLFEGYTVFEIADMLSFSKTGIESCISCIREKTRRQACLAAA